MEEPVKEYIGRHIRAAIIVGSLVFILIVRWAIVRLNYKMRLMRDGFWDFLVIAFWVLLVGAIIVLLTVALINYYGREKINHERTGTTDLKEEDI
jgi:uncharacterized membrane protein